MNFPRCTAVRTFRNVYGHLRRSIVTYRGGGRSTATRRIREFTIHLRIQFSLSIVSISGTAQRFPRATLHELDTKSENIPGKTRSNERKYLVRARNFAHYALPSSEQARSFVDVAPERNITSQIDRARISVDFTTAKRPYDTGNGRKLQNTVINRERKRGMNSRTDI